MAQNFLSDIKLGDNIYIRLGNATNGDLHLHHNGTNSYIQNDVGHFYIKNRADDADIIFQSDDGSGGVATYYTIDGGNEANLFSKNVKLSDSVELRIGDSNDLKIYHGGTHSFIDNQTGNLYIRNYSDDKNIHFQTDDGSGGITDYIVVNGQENIVKFQEHTRHLDNKQARFGTGSDLKILHNGTDSYIQNFTGTLQIQNQSDDKDILLRTDDGSGGVATYFYLDGSAVLNRFPKSARWDDNIHAQFGAAADLKIYHDATNSIISNDTGDIRFIQYVDDGKIRFYNDNGSGGTTEYFRIDGSAEETLFSKQIRVPDNVKIAAGGSQDLQIFHDGSHSYIADTGTGELRLRSDGISIQSANGNEYMAFFAGTGAQAVSLYAGNAVKFQTTSTGATVTGALTVTGDLIVNGTTTTINTATVEVEDNILQLNTTQGSPDTATAATSGISIYRGNGVTQASFIFDDGDDTWDLTNNLKVEGKLGIGSLNTSYDLYNNGSTYLNGAVTIDHNLDITSNGVIRMGGTEVISAARAINATSATFAGDVTISSDTPELLFTDTDNNVDAKFIANNGNLGIFADTNNERSSSIIYFNIDGDEKARFTSGGKLGIGTGAVLGAKLHVKNNVVSEPLALFQTVTAGDASVRIEGIGGETYLEIANTHATTGDTSNSWGIGMDDNTSLSFGWGANNTLNKSHYLTITNTGNATFTNLVTIGPGTTGSPYDSTTFLHVKGTTRSIVQQSSTTDAYYMFGDAAANNVGWIGYNHSTGNANIQAENTITLYKPTNVVGTFEASDNVLAKSRLTVGQNTVNGSYGLYAAGSFGVGGNSTFAGAIDTSGELTINNAVNNNNLGIHIKNDNNLYSGALTFWTEYSGTDTHAARVQAGTDGTDAALYLQVANTSKTLTSVLTLDHDLLSTFAGNVNVPSGYVGRDSHNGVYFSTDDSIIYRVADSHRFRMDSDTFRPYADSSYDLGTNSVRWRNLYADTLYGDGSNLTNISATDNTKLPLTGGTLTGDLTMGGTSGIFIPEYIYHVGDTNTYFGFPGNDEYKVTVGGSTKIFADASNAYLYYSGNQKLRTTNTGVTVTGGVVALGNMSSFETTLTNNDDWQNSPISILERGDVGSSQTADKYSPNLNFHWGGIVSRSLWMDHDGHLHYGEYSSTGVPSDTDGHFLANEVRASILRDKDSTGYYLDPAGTGTSLNVAGGATIAGPVRLPHGSTSVPSVATSVNGNTNTGMYWPADHQLGFTVNNSRKFYLSQTQAFFQNLSSGVQINSSSDAPLEVKSSDATTGIKFTDNNGNAKLYYVGSGDYFYTDAHKLGIGDVTAPSVALHVVGTDNVGSRFIFTKDLSTDKILFGGADHDTFGGPFIGSSSNHAFTITQNGATAVTIDTSKHATFAGDIKLADNNKIKGTTYSAGFISFESDGETRISANDDVVIGYGETLNISNAGVSTFAGDVTVNGGDFNLTKQNGSPYINMLYDGTNPGTNTLLHYFNFRVDYDGTHQDWGGIEHRTNASAVRTDLRFNVKSTSGNVQTGLAIRGQASAAPLVGIGTSDPDAKLEIIGNGDSNSTTALRVRSSDDQQLFYVRDDGVVSVTHNYFYVDNPSGMYSNGKIHARGGVTDDGGTLGLGGSNAVDNLVLTSNTLAEFAGDVQVNGDLIVTGTSTTVNVEDLNVEQGEITLNYGTGDTSAAANNSGIRIQDAVNSSTDATMLWDTSSDRFNFSHGLTTATGTVRFTHQQNGGSRLELYNNRQDLSNVEVYRIAAYNSVEVTGVHFYRGGGGSSGYTKIFAKKDNSSSLEEVVQFGANGALDTTFSGTINTTSTATGAITLNGGTGVATTGAFVLRQNGDSDGNGIAITSSHATSHRIWKDASGNLNIGSSGNSNAFKQDTSGNSTFEGLTSTDNLDANHFGIKNTSSTTKDGISLYGGYQTGEPTYGILFTGTAGLGTYGSVTSDWATYFTMNNNNARGWIFRKAGSGNTSSISAGGIATFGSSTQSPIFYDSVDTAYYLDPGSTGTSLKAAGSVEHKGLSMTDGTNVDQVKQYNMTFQLTANTWTDTGIDGTDLATGTYAVQVYVDDHNVNGNHYDEYYSGMMSWYSANTNSSAVDEIVLHRAGHAPNAGDIQLRTQRTENADSHDLMLQIKHTRTYNAALDNSSDGKIMRFKFRRLI